MVRVLHGGSRSPYRPARAKGDSAHEAKTHHLKAGQELEVVFL